MVEKLKSLEKLASGLNSSSPSDESKFSSSFIVNERGDSNVQSNAKDLQLVNLQELEAVRKAFDTNQQILAQHKEKLTVSNEFVSFTILLRLLLVKCFIMFLSFNICMYAFNIETTDFKV